MQEIRKSRKSEKVGIRKIQKIRKEENQKKLEILENKIKQGKNIDQIGHG